MPIQQRFAPPTNDDDFERLCLELLRLHWSRPGLEIFGKRGERQFGIDILDVAGETPICAAQCKLKEEHKSLPPAEIQAEVDKARKFTPPIGKYGILTTGKVSTKSQRKVREINELHKLERLFEVELFTWERLCSMLLHYEDVQEQFYGGMGFQRAKKMGEDLTQIKDGVQSLTSTISGTQLDFEINEARDCIKNGDFQLATFLLNRIQRRQHDLTPRQKFQVLSNHGAAALGASKIEESARYFLEAASHQPDDEQGQTNEVLAYLLVGDLTASHEKATLLRRRYPASARLAALWVTTAPQTIPVENLETEINSPLKSDAEVSIALARRAVTEFAFDKARDYATLANKAAPRWAQTELALAEINVRKALYLQSGSQPLSGKQTQLLREAEEVCSRSLEVARTENDRNSEITSLIQRVDVRLLLKDRDGAAADAEVAQHMDPDDARVLLAVAQVRLASGRVDEGLSILERAHNLSSLPAVAFILGSALYERGRDGDVENALRVLRGISLSVFRRDIRATVVTQVIQCYAKKKNWTDAKRYLDGISEHLEPVVVEAIRGFLAYHEEARHEAEQHATKAHSLLAPDTIAETKSFVARLLMLVGRPTDALAVWQDVFDLNSPGFDVGNLLDCAARLRKDDIILKTCEQLHARGINNWDLLEFELAYLQKYNIDGAIERLTSFIRDNPDHKMAKLRLSLIGLLLSRPELVSASVDALPSVNELPPECAISAVHVLRFAGDPMAAVDYAYRYLRVHFDDVRAHQAMIASMTPGLPEPHIPPTLETVSPNAAVCYQEMPSGELKWAVLEQTDSTNSDFEEISAASTLASELIGKKVGDVTVIAKGAIQDRTASIVQILPKYVRRYQDSMSEMQIRFGAAGAIESVRVDLADGANGTTTLEPILTSLKRRAEAVDAVRELYQKAPVSLHMYGTNFGHNAYDAMIDLAQATGQQVKCTLGSATERRDARQSLETAQAVVLDITALATLRLLGLTKVLSSTSYKFILPQSVSVALHEMLTDARMHVAQGGTFSYENGRPVLYEQTAATKTERNREDSEILHLIEGATERRSGVGLAELEPSKRELLEKIFGQCGSEAMILASDPSYVLWTDDVVQAQAAAKDFGVQRVWTQLVLETLADAGLITANEYADASARLIGMEFVSTAFDPTAMVAGFKLAEWSTQQRPAAQFVKVFSDPTTDLRQLFAMFLRFIAILYSEATAVSSRCVILRSLMDALTTRPEAIALLESLRRLTSQVFGINVVGEKQFRECFDIWHKQRKLSVLIIP